MMATESLSSASSRAGASMLSLHMSAEHGHEHERTGQTMSRLQHNKWVGALSQSHPGLCGTPVGPGKDTHGTPVPAHWKAVGGSTQPPRDDQRQHDRQSLETNVLSGNKCRLTLGNLQKRRRGGEEGVFFGWRRGRWKVGGFGSRFEGPSHQS